MRSAFVLVSMLIVGVLVGQPRVLHFTRTSGFDHGTRAVSYALLSSIATELGIVVDDDATGDPFTDPATLAGYDAIIFGNTSGNAILDAVQRANFEQWVAGGGHVLGIHAASDTYRHSTANGANTGTWDFYAELVGASVQENPNHVSGTPQYAMEHIGTHPSTAGLPDPWVKNEEYYYWEGGYFNVANTEVLRVEGTVGPNGQVNSYDAPRPMSWYRVLPNGSRLFYTALGHAQSNYTGDVLFRTHVRDALQWLLGGTVGIGERRGSTGISVFPNPADDMLHVTVDRGHIGRTITLHDVVGRVVMEQRVEGERFTLPVSAFTPGSYALRMGDVVAMVQLGR